MAKTVRHHKGDLEMSTVQQKHVVYVRHHKGDLETSPPY